MLSFYSDGLLLNKNKKKCWKQKKIVCNDVLSIASPSSWNYSIIENFFVGSQSGNMFTNFKKVRCKIFKSTIAILISATELYHWSVEKTKERMGRLFERKPTWNFGPLNRRLFSELQYPCVGGSSHKIIRCKTGALSDVRRLFLCLVVDSIFLWFSRATNKMFWSGWKEWNHHIYSISR